MSTLTRPTTLATSRQQPIVWRELVTALLGLWLVVAVYTDGWAHLNRPGLETFFTAWHGALYAGLAVNTGWLAWLAWRGRVVTGDWRTALPAGYRGAVAGVVIFGVGGVADLAWHEIFGIEIGIDALLSPSHLMLFTGGLLIVSTAWRAQRANSPERAGLPELVSLATTVALVGFFLVYASAFASAEPVAPFHLPPEGAPGHQAAEQPIIASLAGYLVTTALITVPLLLTLRAGRQRFGVVTLLVACVGWLTVGMIDAPGIAVAGAIGATVGALLADVLLATARLAGRYRLSGLAAATIALVWAGQLAGFAIADAVRWPVSLWAGVILLTGYAAAALGLLATPHRLRDAGPRIGPADEGAP